MTILLLMLGGINPQDETMPEVTEIIVKEWATTLAPVTLKMNSRLTKHLTWYDPRPKSSFVKFTDEKLNRYIVRQEEDVKHRATPHSSEAWFYFALNPKSNPLVDPKCWPTSYSLPLARDRLSLLRYVGAVEKRPANFTESAYGITVEITLLPEERVNGIRKQVLFDLLKSTVTDRYIDRTGPKIIDESEKLCKAGYVISSIGEGDDLKRHYQSSESWPITGLVTHEAIMVFLLKPPPATINGRMAFAGRQDEKDWLPQYLTDKDGVRLVEKLFGKEYLVRPSGLRGK